MWERGIAQGESCELTDLSIRLYFLRTAGKKIVLDNASFHRCKLVRKVVETAGCEFIYLPKYSLDLNPIEHQWRRIKHRVRKPMTSTTQNLHDLIDSAISFICQPLPA
jgi:transposase